MRFSSFLLCVFLLCLPLFASSKLVYTPGGPLPSECVHAIPHGSRVSRCPQSGRLMVFDSSDNVIQRIPRCPVRTPRFSVVDDPFPPDYRGWLAYLAFNVSTHFDAFLSDFSVPDAPASAPDMLYLFPGAQNIDWVPLVDPVANGQGFDIIQPVLQYPADEGLEWSVKSWYVTIDDGAVYSPEVVVQPGDVIFGNMTRLNQTGWYIGSTSLQQQQTTGVTVNHNRLWPQKWSYLTLECYGCGGCSSYPTQPLHFSKMSLIANGAQVQPQWKINPKKPLFHFCNERSQINADGTVDILFQ